MKTTFILFFILVSLASSAQLNRIIIDEETNGDILYGQCTREAFLMPEFSYWFNEEYESYNVNDEALMPGYSIKFDSIYIFMGSWCEDSHREIPRFCKIMDHEYFDGTDIKFYCLDRNKTTDVINTEEYYIQLVPTFIFYYRGEELCRIIEQPKETLEADIMDLLKRIQP